MKRTKEDYEESENLYESYRNKYNKVNDDINREKHAHNLTKLELQKLSDVPLPEVVVTEKMVPESSMLRY